MNFPVSYFIPGYRAVTHCVKVFTPEECDKIIAMGELIAHKNGGYQKGLVGTSPEGGQNTPDIRITDVAWLEPNRENDWVHRTISRVVGRINSDRYRLDLDSFDGFQFSVYEGNQQAHYDWHIDVTPEPKNPASHRKLSVSIMLSDPSEYEGGQLFLNTHGNPDKSETPKMGKGDMVLFYSFVPHRVEPVTKGVRRTLVTWACGEKFR